MTHHILWPHPLWYQQPHTHTLWKHSQSEQDQVMMTQRGGGVSSCWQNITFILYWSADVTDSCPPIRGAKLCKLTHTLINLINNKLFDIYWTVLFCVWFCGDWPDVLITLLWWCNEWCHVCVCCFYKSLNINNKSTPWQHMYMLLTTTQFIIISIINESVHQLVVCFEKCLKCFDV